MWNPFTVKKWAGLLVAGICPTLVFYVVIVSEGMTYALGGWIAGVLVSSLIANNLLRTPFREIVEGKGILALEIDSTGIIKPFVIGVHTPYLEGVDAFGDSIKEVFDRETIFHIDTPTKTGKVQQGLGKDGKIRTAIVIDEDKYNKARFGMWQYPTVIYNKQLGTLITKDWLSEKEKTSFAEHQVLYLNRKVEELSSHVRDFARHVVDQLKPNQMNKWAKLGLIVLIVGLVALAILFGKPVWDAITAATGGSLTGIGGLP